MLVFVFVLFFHQSSVFIKAQYGDVFKHIGNELGFEKNGQYKNLRDYSFSNIRSYTTSQFAPFGYHSNGYGQDIVTDNEQQPKTHLKAVTLVRRVTQPPINMEMEKKFPLIKMTSERPYSFEKPYSFAKHVSVVTEKPIGYPIKMYIPQPYYEKYMSMRIPVEKQMSMYVSRPHSMVKEKFFDQLLETRTPSSLLRSPYRNTNSVNKANENNTPYSIEKQVLYPMYIPHEGLVPVYYSTNKAIPYPVPVPVHFPVEMPIPISVIRHEPVYIPVRERMPEVTEQSSVLSKPNAQTFAVPAEIFISTAVLRQNTSENGISPSNTTVASLTSSAEVITDTHPDNTHLMRSTEPRLENIRTATNIWPTNTTIDNRTASQIATLTEESAFTTREKNR